MNSIPSSDDSPKLCQCGCGQPAPLATRTDPRRGSIKGQPQRFIAGHYYCQHDPIKRFWLYVDRSGGPDACWLWVGTVRKGYGLFRRNYTNYGAHRIAWELAHGPISSGLCVCHNCPTGDNPLCCNPAHLWLGTVRENDADRDRKGRQARGTRNPATRATADQVLEIRQRHAAGESCIALARVFGLGITTVKAMIKRKTWQHL